MKKEDQNELTMLRQQIDEHDRKLVEVLAERFKTTAQVGEYKAKHGLPPMDKERERKKFAALAEMARSRGLNEDLVQDLFERIIEEVRREHRIRAGEKEQ